MVISGTFGRFARPPATNGFGGLKAYFGNASRLPTQRVMPANVNRAAPRLAA